VLIFRLLCGVTLGSKKVVKASVLRSKECVARKSQWLGPGGGFTVNIISAICFDLRFFQVGNALLVYATLVVQRSHY